MQMDWRKSVHRLLDRVRPLQASYDQLRQAHFDGATLETLRNAAGQDEDTLVKVIATALLASHDSQQAKAEAEGIARGNPAITLMFAIQSAKFQRIGITEASRVLLKESEIPPTTISYFVATCPTIGRVPLNALLAVGYIEPSTSKGTFRLSKKGRNHLERCAANRMRIRNLSKKEVLTTCANTIRARTPLVWQALIELEAQGDEFMSSRKFDRDLRARIRTRARDGWIERRGDFDTEEFRLTTFGREFVRSASG